MQKKRISGDMTDLNESDEAILDRIWDSIGEKEVSDHNKALEIINRHVVKPDQNLNSLALEIIENKFNPGQPRDNRGRWSAGGGGASGSSKSGKGGGIGGEATTKVPNPPPYTPNVETEDSNGVTTHARVGVPADSVPPPPDKIPRLPNLTLRERRAEGKFARAFESDPDGMADKFLNGLKATTEPGKALTFGTDDAKMLNQQWMHKDKDIRMKNRAELNTPLHQTANAITKKAFVKHLDTLKEGDEVLVTVGGCGAGKGYAMGKDKDGIPFVPEAYALKNKAKVVWDSAGDQNATENPWILKEAEKRGLKVNYVYVSADPHTQWADPGRGVIKRAHDPKDGRMVDAKVFADSYVLGAQNHNNFFQANKENKNASFVFLQNGNPPKKLDGVPPAALTMDRTKLAKFAIQTVHNTDAAPHVKRGALMGERIWED